MAADSLIVMFPGQNSRYPEMVEKIAAENAICAAALDRASAILGRDLAAHYRSGNAGMFARNRDVQIGIFIANHLHMLLLKDAGIHADWSLGMSLGEYNHLVHVGALTFEDALALIEERGRLYEEGPLGVMVSVFRVEAEVVDRKIEELGLEGRVAVGLYNSPRQQVLSGEHEAVFPLIAALEEDQLIEFIEIDPLMPMHSPIFAPVAEKFRDVLAGTRIEAPLLAYVPNVTGTVLFEASPDDVRSHLASHICASVLWQASVDSLASRVSNAHFVEVGPRAVLSNLFGRGWMPGRRSKTDAGENWPQHIRALIAELHNGR